MKFSGILFFFAIMSSCSNSKSTLNAIKLIDSLAVVNYANTITAGELSEHLYTFSSDEFEGRRTGESGQIKAAQFLSEYYKGEGILSPIDSMTYFQNISQSFLPNYNATQNVLAFIEGSEKPEEVLIISAHLDHEGVKEGKIYNGADDNGSGTVAIMEIAQAFNIAKKEGKHPKRSVLFLHVTAEEIGLKGSQYYTENPVFELKNTIANLNIDMIGRIDEKHKKDKNYIYLIGSDRLSTELHDISEKVNTSLYNLKLDYNYNEEDDYNKFYYRSDHYNFAKHDIPVIFYNNGTHEDYHKHTDTAEKIDYDLLAKRSKLVFATAWQLVNRDHRIVSDKAEGYLDDKELP